LSLQHCPRDDILTRDQLNLEALAIPFVTNRRRNFGIGIEECVGKKTVDEAPAERRLG